MFWQGKHAFMTKLFNLSALFYLLTALAKHLFAQGWTGRRKRRWENGSKESGWKRKEMRFVGSRYWPFLQQFLQTNVELRLQEFGKNLSRWMPPNSQQQLPFQASTCYVKLSGRSDPLLNLLNRFYSSCPDNISHVLYLGFIVWMIKFVLLQKPVRPKNSLNATVSTLELKVKISCPFLTEE